MANPEWDNYNSTPSFGIHLKPGYQVIKIQDVENLKSIIIDLKEDLVDASLKIGDLEAQLTSLKYKYNKTLHILDDVYLNEDGIYIR